MKRNLSLNVFLLAVLLSLEGCGLFVPSHHDPKEYQAIHAAAEGGDIGALKTLLDRDPSLVKRRDWDGLTVLHLAIVHKHTEAAAYLLTRGACVKAKSKDGVTPLHFAAQVGSLDLVKLLLERKANINAVDSEGWTPLDRATKWNHTDVAEYLRQHGGRSKNKPEGGPSA